ncbi:MAG: glycoside hydrolase family 3 protein [Oscillospiraceae bacterium]|nr:glycoside hydrolase family 3 protein [Oscillospiraceae bacterium]
MKRTLSALLSFLLAISAAGCGSADTEDIAQTTTNTPTFTQYNVSCTFPINTEEDVPLYQKYAEMSPEEITASLTLEQKAAQMVQPVVYMLSESDMKANCYGSILSKSSSVTYTEWQSIVDGYQQSAVLSDAGIPYLYGQDDVHGVNYCDGAVIFPHNIGIGAANDPELTYQMGLATADEAKLCHMLWNFAPCVAQSEDPRWGRTYESYGSDLEIIKSLGTAYTRGLVDGGVIACAKHFFGDGNVEYGTGENSDAYRLIDRGNAELSEEEISALLDVYRAEIEAGVQTIMISHSAVNGLKMHENAQYIQYLKNELGFEGFIVSDWNSVQNTSPSTYKEQVITAVNAGIDMLMEVDRFDEAMQIIIEAVQSGDIPEERVNDAVCRIIRVKLDEGIFDDPFCENMETVQSETGSEEYRALAEQLVEKSLVLLKNEGDVLPIKEGASVYITGPAADSPRAQCGGWTIDWNQSPSEEINGVTTILEGFKQKAAEYGITIITDKNEAENADIVLLAVGEQAYAEWLGDTEDMELCGAFGLSGNSAAIEEAKALEKPTVACIVAGRQVIIDDYADDWDAVVMCYLPGSEGQGIADVLCGGSDFTGRLPSPWYSSTNRIGTGDCWLEKGFGISY